ncbi:MAG: type I-E CRISPR-associated protein Cas7/Cse4/CasC [Armatimonadetes bacterium]|nr:type I-E CRISPR-associated protein Cas7/Cse4/CasC [Armatimonadota bacterium]
MLIEIHMIQNHSPANLNRDDLGAPKTCVFGGVTRARISSQCLKRSIRNPGNPEEMHNREPGMFAQAMAGHIGFRTKLFPWLVGQVLDDSSVKDRFLMAGTAKNDYENVRKAIIAACEVIAKKEKNERGGREEKGKKDDRPQTPQLIFLGPGHARSFVDKLLEAQPEHRNHFLDPKTIFESLLEHELTTTFFLTDEQRERALKGGWRIKNTEQRMKELEQTMTDTEETDTDSSDGEVMESDNSASSEDRNEKNERSDEEVARIIAQALDKLASQDVKKFESVTSIKGRKGEPKLDTERKEPPKYGEFLKSLAAIPSGDAVDIALFGRMTTSPAFQDVEAAMQVAHPISTHAAVTETDYFTAVDDLGKSGGGAGHVDEAMYVSACFYKYFSLDWDQLLFNLAGPEPSDEIKTNAMKLAAATLGHFIRAAAMTTPSGKQNSFASNNEPCGVLVEIKEDKTPTSYANAFAEPARRIGDAPDDSPDYVSLTGRSIAQLGDHVHALRSAYGIDSMLLWYSPQAWRYPLQGWERESDGQKKKEDGKEKPPVLFAKQVFDVLGGEKDKPAGLVEAVVKEVSGFEWVDICDPGKATSKEA